MLDTKMICQCASCYSVSAMLICLEKPIEFSYINVRKFDFPEHQCVFRLIKVLALALLPIAYFLHFDGAMLKLRKLQLA